MSEQTLAELRMVAAVLEALAEERKKAEAAAVALREALVDVNAARAGLRTMAIELRKIFHGDDEVLKSPMIQ